VSVTCAVCGAATTPWRLDRRNTVDRCPTCGTVERDLGRAPAGARAPAYGGDPGLDRWRLAATYRRLRGLVPTGGRVFEVGFGSGALLRRFLDDGVEVAGTDPGMLGQRVDPRVAARGDLSDRPLASRPGAGGHDLVVGVHVVEHVTDPSGFARACHDLLRPGGRLVLVTPAADGAGLPGYRSRWWMFEDPTHVRFLTARSAARLLTDAGLVDVRVRRLLTDSLATDAASWARTLAWRRLPRAGVLSWRTVRVLVLITAPVVLAARAVAPSARPVIEVSGTRPEAAG
jgi:SAM-dependent methyltransferase